MALIHLSTLDQHAPREYIRYALLLACADGEALAASESLKKVVKKTIAELPVLAGTVEANKKVSVTLQQVERFSITTTSPAINSLDFATICADGVPPRHIASERLTPLADSPNGDISPACAIQANFINGGLLLVFFLHHAVADIKGITSILRTMSEELPSRKLSEGDLLAETTAATYCRDNMSQSKRRPAFSAADRTQGPQQTHQTAAQQQQNSLLNTTNAPSVPQVHVSKAAVFSFKVEHVITITDTINGRRANRRQRATTSTTITAKDVLMALCWRAITRAKHPLGGYHDLHTMSISFNMNARETVKLEADYLGNAEVTAKGAQSINQLVHRYDPTTIETSAVIIRDAANTALSEDIIRSHIATNNENPDAARDTPADLVFNDWSESQPELTFSELDLGLGLGKPVCVRKIGREFGSGECTIMPVSDETRSWEVQMELLGDVMDRIYKDDEFLRFVWTVAY